MAPPPYGRRGAITGVARSSGGGSSESVTTASWPAGWVRLTVAIAAGGWAIGLGGAGLAVALGSQFRLPQPFEPPFFAFSAIVSVLVGTAIIGRTVGVRNVVEWVWALVLVGLINFMWGSFIPLWLVMID